MHTRNMQTSKTPVLGKLAEFSASFWSQKLQDWSQASFNNIFHHKQKIILKEKKEI